MDKKRLRWKLAGLAALAYLVMPLDAIPDVIPLLGWVDDVGVLSAAALYIRRELRSRQAGAEPAQAHAINRA